MISVKKDYEQVPSGLRTEGAEKKREAALREGNLHNFSSDCYAHDSVKEKLREIYRDKCAYCECKTSEGVPLQVEHYRPKKNTTEDKGHPGYYWIGYEWSNLLLSCAKCNRAKSNQFPIEGVRVKSPQAERAEWRADSESFKAENPLLLNPELDYPEEHLVFCPDGNIKEKDGSQRGRKTIEICELNREDLEIARKAVVDRFRKNIWKQFVILYTALKEGKLENKEKFGVALQLAFKTLFEDIINAKHPMHKFSRLGWHTVNDFKQFFVDNLEEGEQREIVIVAFERFQTEWV